MLNRKAIAIAVLLALSTPWGSAFAQEREGLVMMVDANQIVLDVGTNRGVKSGDVVEVWRPVKIKHPVTGKTIVDRFRIGSLEITQARPNVSVARQKGELERTMLPGDVVVLPVPESPTSEPTPLPAAVPVPLRTEAPAPVRTEAPSPVAPPAPAPPRNAAAEQIDSLLRSVAGATPETRIAAYKKFVLDHPQNPHAPLLWKEANDLERLVSQDHEAQAKVDDRPTLLAFKPPKLAPPDTPLTLALEVKKAHGAILHVRRRGEPSFRSTPMHATGVGYFDGTIPAELMKEGELEYFVEVASERGEVRAIAGDAEHPHAVQIENPIPPDTTAPTKDRAIVRASLLTDYASFSSKGNDTMWQTEGQLGVRFGDVGLRALRSGFGVYRGKGGTLEDLDQLNRPPRAVGLTYGHIEIETAFSPWAALVMRGIIGLRDTGISGGTAGFIRIGNDRKTNLLFGGEFLGGIGVRGITQVELNAIHRVPITLRSEVTNQPAGVSRQDVDGDASTGQGEIGVRSILQVGYRLLPNLVVAGRVSFQARTINHAGPGGGAAVMLEW